MSEQTEKETAQGVGLLAFISAMGTGILAGHFFGIAVGVGASLLSFAAYLLMFGALAEV